MNQQLDWVSVFNSDLEIQLFDFSVLILSTDAYCAQQLVQTLLRLATEQGTTIMCTIHQPSSKQLCKH